MSNRIDGSKTIGIEKNGEIWAIENVVEEGMITIGDETKKYSKVVTRKVSMNLKTMLEDMTNITQEILDSGNPDKLLDTIYDSAKVITDTFKQMENVSEIIMDMASADDDSTFMSKKSFKMIGRLIWRTIKNAHRKIARSKFRLIAESFNLIKDSSPNANKD